MPNTLGNYNPIFFAQTALIQLEKALGMANRVYRGYETERNTEGRELGETIRIRKPSTFAAASAPSVAQDLDTKSVTLTLDQWQEVKFALTDKELAFTGERIINEHVRPAAYALADKIDQDLVTLYKDVPWVYDLNAVGSIDVGDITGPRKVMFDNAVPLSDEANLHYMITGAVEEEFLQLQAFAQAQGAGDAGLRTQLRGSLGRKYGFEIFANQNVATHDGTTPADQLGAINGAGAKGDTTIAFDGVTASHPFKKGDSFVFAGATQRHVLTADVTADGTGAVASASIYPELPAIVADDTVMTFDIKPLTQSLMFHRNFGALALAPLPETGGRLGADVFTATDPRTGLSLRARMFYDGDNSKVIVALDVLYGYIILDGNLAVRCRQ